VGAGEGRERGGDRWTLIEFRGYRDSLRRAARNEGEGGEEKNRDSSRGTTRAEERRVGARGREEAPFTAYK